MRACACNVCGNACVRVRVMCACNACVCVCVCACVRACGVASRHLEQLGHTDGQQEEQEVHACINDIYRFSNTDPYLDVYDNI